MHRLTFSAAWLLLLVHGPECRANGAGMISPVPGGNISSTVTFNWSEGPGGYWLYVGTTGTGSRDISTLAAS